MKIFDLDKMTEAQSRVVTRLENVGFDISSTLSSGDDQIDVLMTKSKRHGHLHAQVDPQGSINGEDEGICFKKWKL